VALGLALVPVQLPRKPNVDSRRRHRTVVDLIGEDVRLAVDDVRAFQTWVMR
jgi:hypothetical protein